MTKKKTQIEEGSGNIVTQELMDSLEEMLGDYEEDFELPDFQKLE